MTTHTSSVAAEPGNLGGAWLRALVAASRALQHLEPCEQVTDTQLQAVQARLSGLAHLDTEQHASAFAAAAQQAWEHLLAAYHDTSTTAHVLPLLAAPGPSLDAFRQAAAEELLLSSQPNIGRLLDYYRREMRWHLPTDAPPPWTEIEPPLRLFLHTLLPRALDTAPDLQHLLPTDEQRDLLDQARSHAAAARTSSLARIEELLAELTAQPAAQQGLIASGGSTIEHVQQTIIVGPHHPAPLAPAELAALYRRYQGFLIETFGSLDFRGILQLQNVVRLRLEDIYVPLMGQPGPPPDTTIQPANTAPPTNGTPVQRHQQRSSDPPPPAAVPLHDLVRDQPFLVVLGDPGAGKSTLVRALLLALADGSGYQRFGLVGSWLPILFPVAAFAEARQSPGGQDLAPLVYLSTYYSGLSQPDYGALFWRALQTGRALVLFDGLDEVRGDRLALVRCLEAFVREWDAPGNRFVATSRIAGYDDAPLDDRLFVRATVQPLSDAGIRRFITQWSAAYERAGAQGLPIDPLVAALELQRRIEQRAHDLQAAVFTNANVNNLARSPLLLTILALVHQQGASLPDRRVDLYRLCVEALAETWNRSRSLTGREVDVYLGTEKIDERFVVNLLGPAALWMQQHQPGGLVERHDLEHQLARTLSQTDGLPHGRAQRLARSFIELMQYDTGLLQERGYQRYGFLHLTFEEYLAARALLESVTVQRPDDAIHQCCVDPAWREVLRLMVAAASQREAQRLLLHLLTAPTTPATRGRPTVLAGECLLDIGRNGATQHAWCAVVEQLGKLASNPQPPREVRIAGCRVLGELGDPRLLDIHSGDAPTGGYWCPINTGSFWYCSDDTTLALHAVDLPYDYQIARFPITNADYRQFIAAGGYRQRHWWTEHGSQFVQSAALAEHPATTSSSKLSRPVVGVSWYEAAAYCAWLSEQGHQAGWLPSQYIIRLPTSLEWERAARHTDTRRYPWGDAAPSPEHANYDATGIHAPTPVGCFPLGAAACGALDLAGNVWEWTATPADAHHQPAPCADFAPDTRPVIRGGAFNWSRDYLHCGARYWFTSSYRQNLLGFRVVCCPQDIPHHPIGEDTTNA
jgi:formylglycine-generating enzyme required for sulfatase activity/energy-coupling factor transporter ATP-binding protein EcfA2